MITGKKGTPIYAGP